MMYRHPWISASFGISSNIIILMMIIVVSWSRFLAQESLTDGADVEEEDTREEEDGKERLHDESVAANDDNDRERNGEEIPRHYLGILTGEPSSSSRPQQRPSLGWSVFMALINLTMLISLGYIFFTAYQNGVYEPSKLMEIIRMETESLMFGNESVSSVLANVFTWDDIFVKLFVVKIVTVIMLLLIMNTTRFIE